MKEEEYFISILQKVENKFITSEVFKNLSPQQIAHIILIFRELDNEEQIRINRQMGDIQNARKEGKEINKEMWTKIMS